MVTVLKWLNDNHWFVIGGVVIAALCFWTWGCTSTVPSLLNPGERVCRAELQAEIDYYVAMAKSRAADLDRQDEAKQELLDAANVLGTSGQINPSGLLNLAASIGAISFGLNRNQKYKNVMQKTTPTVTT